MEQNPQVIFVFAEAFCPRKPPCTVFKKQAFQRIEGALTLGK